MHASNAPKRNDLVKISWSEQQSLKQTFSLPSTIIYYISKNPSTSTQYLKLAQSCKYFFEQQPILIAKDILEADTDEAMFCTNYEYYCLNNDDECCVHGDLHKLKTKIWLTHMIKIAELDETDMYLPQLLPKIYRLDIEILWLSGERILIKDLKFLAFTVVESDIYLSKFFHDDGSNVMLDEILSVFPKVKIFRYDCTYSVIGPSCLKNIAKLINLSNLQFFYLFDISELPNVQDFLFVIKALKNVKIKLQFNDEIDNDAFNNQMDAFVDDVIKDETTKCVIRYDAQDYEKLKLMQKRYQ